MPRENNQVLVQNVESLVPNSQPVILNNVSQEHAWWFTFAEIETKYFLSRILQNDSICFDVGANIGMYSLMFLQDYAASEVFAFEPSSNFRFLEQNISVRFKGRFHSFQLCLGDTDGEIESTIWESFGHKEVKGYFKFSTLDTFLRSYPVHKIDVLKIDTDGFETQILDGAVKTLLKYRPLIIIESDDSAESGQSSARIEMVLNGMGYLHLGTLDGNNEIYAHRSDSRLSEFKRFVRRNFKIDRTFLGALNRITPESPTSVLEKNLKFTSNANFRFFFQKAFYTTGIPWNYVATSSSIGGSARFLRISGLVLGSDSNLICISESGSTVFSLPLPTGIYSKILIPLHNLGGATNIHLVVRGSGHKGRALILGLEIDILT
jgi:FkbM family methyltransferase